MTQALQFAESGEGDIAICVLAGPSQALMDVLADDFAVLSLRPDQLAGDVEARASALLAAARARGASRFSLVAQGADCSLALLAAAQAPDCIDALVLLSPTALDAGGTPVEGVLAGRLSEVKAQTLALFGTRSLEAPPAMAGHYKRALPACHLIYVFDAADTGCERLEAVSEVVMDFLRRREAFLVSDKDGRIHA